MEAKKKGAADPESIGTDPSTGLPVFLLSGRFGHLLSIGHEER